MASDLGSAHAASFDLTPDPKILIALTHTPLAPLDALSELIDNAIDSFTHAKLLGRPVDYPLVVVDLPAVSEVGRGEGKVSVRDNGPGLTADYAESALRAGYSSNNPHDTLGLFGMGFNIASGKLGQRTRFLTARTEDEDALEVLIDLQVMQDQKTYLVPTRRVPKPDGFTHGTIVEVTGWWPDGNPNSGFIRKLVSYGKSTILRELGRRYATVLAAESGVRMRVRNDSCDPFEHCVWGAERFVERKEHGKIPARFSFDTVLHTQIRCTSCDALVPQRAASCVSCGSAAMRSIEERVRGWVGIQRFDDPTNFGVDLIRNGRTIKIGEKGAFFTFVDEFKRELKDYPIDSPFGRIVGEVHLDHVPVDFLKQDFQRSSEEWQRAMTFLRGNSSLQPTQLGAEANRSPVYTLYQGYRRVRNPGKADMYMGAWDVAAGKAKRISRDVEREYYQRFQDRETGYYDDAEWWRLVETADQPPVEELIECPDCSAENLKGDEVCQVCGCILIGVDCINPDCVKRIARSAVMCPHCGASQIPEVELPWACAVCGTPNAADAESCVRCGGVRGTPNPASLEALLSASAKDDELSLDGLTLRLADDSYSSPLTVHVYRTSGSITPRWQGQSVPLLSFRGDPYSIFVDPSHPVFRGFRVRPELFVAIDVSQFVYDLHRSLLTAPYRGVHSLSFMVWQILDNRWAESLEDNSDRIRQDVRWLFDTITEQLSVVARSFASDFYGDLTEDEQRGLVTNIMNHGQEVGNLGTWRESGEYLKYVEPRTVIQLFRTHPDVFFDGGVWSQQWSTFPDLAPAVLRSLQGEIEAKYLNCLEDCASFLKYTVSEPAVAVRTRGSLDYLTARLL